MQPPSARFAPTAVNSAQETKRIAPAGACSLKKFPKNKKENTACYFASGVCVFLLTFGEKRYIMSTIRGGAQPSHSMERKSTSWQK
jgi:hypothetical protein